MLSFAAPEDIRVAVCVLPGTELAFINPVQYGPTGLFRWISKTRGYRTAIFRQINIQRVSAHHDALEFPDGRFALLTTLKGRSRGGGASVPDAGPGFAYGRDRKRCRGRRLTHRARSWQKGGVRRIGSSERLRASGFIAKYSDNSVSSWNNEPACELFLRKKWMEVTMPILLWLMGVPAIVVIALLVTHVI